MSVELLQSGSLARAGTATLWLTNVLKITREQIVGCTDDEIAEVAATCKRPLPLGYTQWLREAGRRVGTGATAFDFRASSLVYPDVFIAREVALEVIRDHGQDEQLLDEAFPFYNWEVYQLLLLDLSCRNDDPPVLSLDELTGRAERQFDSFSRAMAWKIAGLARFL